MHRPRMCFFFVCLVYALVLNIPAANAGELREPSGMDLWDASDLNNLGSGGLLTDDSPPGYTMNFGWASQMNFAAAGPQDWAMTVDPSGGTTVYWIEGAIVNFTNQPWAGMRIILGQGAGSSFAVSTAQNLTFLIDHVYGSSQPNYGTMAAAADNQDPTSLVWSNQPLLHGDLANFTLLFAVPDVGAAPYDFTIRFDPIPVPEPASALLLLTALPCLLRRRR